MSYWHYVEDDAEICPECGYKYCRCAVIDAEIEEDGLRGWVESEKLKKLEVHLVDILPVVIKK